MRYNLLLIILSLCLFNCEKDKEELIPIENPFANIAPVKLQTFNLPANVNDTIVKGEKGAEIFFQREKFNLKEDDDVIIELKEYYSLKELIANNIQSLTQKGELLKTNGVIYFNVTANGKKLELKEGANLKVKYAKSILEGDKDYRGVKDSLDNFSWVENSNSQVMLTVLDYKTTMKYGGVMTYMDIITTSDSVSYYRELDDNVHKKYYDKIKQISNQSSQLSIYLNLRNSGYTHLGQVIKSNHLPEIKLDFQDNNIDFAYVYFIYEDLNSFILISKAEDFNFKNIPITNKTKLLVIATKDYINYYAEKNINKTTSRDVKLDLKKLDEVSLKNLLKN